VRFIGCTSTRIRLAGAHGSRLRSHVLGIRQSMHALVAYRSYDGAVTVWAFVVSALIVLAVGWYIRRRR